MPTVPAMLPFTQVTLVKLAREIAMDIHDIETILKVYQIDIESWDKIQQNPFFKRALEQEVIAWQGAANTHERVKIKSAAMVEEWLPELNARLHDANEALNHKIEGGKFAARMADIGLSKAEGGGTSERFTVTINLGADAQLRFEKEVTPRVIEGEVVKEPTE